MQSARRAELIRRQKRIERGVTAFWVGIFLFAVTFWACVFAVAIHFIAKAW
jgi:hypothetical protein